ncbi:MAG: class I SAM-dependent methyltransferase [Candidatus Pacebacteria bacterium]|nr:class I SAM-dependent methyltransferase [Candidatus Paceibacterota bacterium]
MFLNPEEILKNIKLRENMIAADFGCGSGGFTIPLAKYLKNGFVYAIDIQEEPLNVLKSRSLDISNIRIHKADLEQPGSSKIPDHSLDLVLLVNVLFQAEEPGIILQEIKRVLKPGADLLVIDWQENASQGPEGKRVSLEKAQNLAEEKGFKKEKDFEAGHYHYGLLMKKA